MIVIIIVISFIIIISIIIIIIISIIIISRLFHTTSLGNKSFTPSPTIKSFPIKSPTFRETPYQILRI